MTISKRKIKNWEIVIQLTLSVTVMFILLYLLFTTKKWYWFPFSQLPVLLLINFGIFDKITVNENSISEKRLFSTKTFSFNDIKEIRLMSTNKKIGFLKESDLQNSHYGIQIYILPYNYLSHIEDADKAIIFDFNKEVWEYLKNQQDTKINA